MNKKTALIIDGFLLVKAYSQVRDVCNKLYPDRKLDQPSFIKTVEEFCRYTTAHDNIDLEVFLIFSPDQQIEGIFSFEIDDFENIQSEEWTTKRVGSTPLHFMKTNDFLSFILEDKAKELLPTHDVILAIDDRAYVPFLQELTNSHPESKVIQLYGDDSMISGSHRLKYTYAHTPIGLAMGIEPHEL